MVEHREDSLHEILLVGKSLHFGPLVLDDRLVSLLIVIDDASLDALDLFVTATLSLLDLLDEVVGLEDGAMGLGLDDVATNELLVGQELAGDSVANVDDAVVLAKKVRSVINLRVGIVIEEDVLSVVISLVDEQELGHLAVEVVLLPVLVVLLNSHARTLLHRLHAVLELRDDVVDEASVFKLLDVVESVLNLLELVSDSLGHACAKLGILQLMREAIVAALLVNVVDSQVLSSLRAVKLDEWGAVPTREAWMVTSAELVELPGDERQIRAESSEADRKLSLLLLEEDQRPEERWDEVVLALTKHLHLLLLVVGELLGARGSGLFVFILIFVLLFGLLLRPERLPSDELIVDVWRVVELILRSLGQVQGL